MDLTEQLAVGSYDDLMDLREKLNDVLLTHLSKLASGLHSLLKT